MNDLSDHVVLPLEAYIELQTAAQVPATTKERLVGAGAASIILLSCAGAVTLGTWGWAKAVEWHEEMQLQRDLKRRREGLLKTQ